MLTDDSMLQCNRLIALRAVSKGETVLTERPLVLQVAFLGCASTRATHAELHRPPTHFGGRGRRIWA